MLLIIFLILSLTLSAQHLNWQNTSVNNTIKAKPGVGYMLLTNSHKASVNLPFNPSPGDEVGFMDVAGTFPFNGLTLDPGALLIDGVKGPVSYSIPHLSLFLIYSGPLYGWQTVSIEKKQKQTVPSESNQGSLLFYDNDVSSWVASDSSYFSYSADSNLLNVHNIKAVPVSDNYGPFVCSSFYDEDFDSYFIHFDPVYGNIVSDFPVGSDIIFHGGQSEGQVLHIDPYVDVSFDVDNGYTTIYLGEDWEYNDYTSITVSFIHDKILNIKSNTKVSGTISSNNFIIKDDTIKIGSIDNINSFDKYSVFIGHALYPSKFYHSVFLGNIDNSVNLINSIAIGYDVYSLFESSFNVWLGCGAGNNSYTSHSILIGYFSGHNAKAIDNSDGSNLIAIGRFALNDAHTDNTISIGNRAGYGCNSSDCIFIGDEAGFMVNDDNLFILKQKSVNATPLLYGDFLNGRLSVNLNSVSAYNLDVGGSGHYSTTLSVDSSLFVSGHIWQTNTGLSVFLGEQAGNADDLTSNKNTFVGYQSGKTNTSGNYNVAVGYQSLLYNSTGGFNTAVGSQALAENTTGFNNTGIGEFSLNSNTGGEGNTALGRNSLQANFTGDYNVAVGKGASFSNAAGSNNTSLGYQAGYNAINSDSNVFIGFQAGFNETGSGKLYIANTNTNTPLIYGEFGNNFLKVNGTLELSGQLQLSNMNTAPASASAPGKAGEIRFTADYIYICVATDTWKRASISTW